MRDGSDNFKNDHGFDFLSYIYGELDQVGRDAFESHLAGCDECAMELAVYSDARLGVIEWRREDFDHLETPAIVVPWASAKQAVVPAEPAGIFSRFIEALSAFPRFSKVGVGLAAVAIALGVFYFGFRPAAVQHLDVAANKNEQQVVLPEEKKQNETLPPQYIAGSEPKSLPSENRTTHSPQVRRQIAAVRTTDHPAIRRNEFAANEPVKSNTPAAKKAPRLTTVEDEDDKSLRLADLFAEIGSSE